MSRCPSTVCPEVIGGLPNKRIVWGLLGYPPLMASPCFTHVGPGVVFFGVTNIGDQIGPGETKESKNVKDGIEYPVFFLIIPLFFPDSILRPSMHRPWVVTLLGTPVEGLCFKSRRDMLPLPQEANCEAAEVLRPTTCDKHLSMLQWLSWNCLKPPLYPPVTTLWDGNVIISSYPIIMLNPNYIRNLQVTHRPLGTGTYYRQRIHNVLPVKGPTLKKHVSKYHHMPPYLTSHYWYATVRLSIQIRNEDSVLCQFRLKTVTLEMLHCCAASSNFDIFN